MSKVAFIGIGAMGEPMAANLLKNGHAVTILRSRRAGVTERLQGAGATVASTPGEAARGCEFVILSLPTSREVETVLLGQDGAAHAAAPGATVIDCTTGNPPDTARLVAALRAKQLGFVAAGMTRGVAGAKQGKLAFFIGGDAAPVEQAKAVLRATGDTFIDFPTAVAAHTAKLVSNVLSYATVALVNEALMLGAKGGVDLKTLHAALMEGAPSKALEAFGPRIVAREYEPPRVSVEHACDDMVLAHALAASSKASLTMLATADGIYRKASAAGHGARDVSILGELWRDGAKA